MATGDQPDAARINTALTSLALQQRNLAAAILYQYQYLNKLGAAALDALGLDGADVLAKIGYLATPAQVYQGTATQAQEFDFADATVSLWAAQ